MSETKGENTRASKAGLGPGSLVHVGERVDAEVSVRVMDYDQHQLNESTLQDFAQCTAYADSASVSWIDADGIHDAHVVEEIGKRFNVHILVLEDVMNSESRPKVEFFDDYMFITLKMLEIEPKSSQLNVEQLSLIISERFVLMFQERPGDSFDGIRERIRTAKGKVRGKDGYYLAYLILDTVVDNYIAVSEKLAVQIETLESTVIKRPTEFTLHRILALRKELLDFKRSIDPLKEAINTVTRELEDEIAKYYKDLYDHIIYESENLTMYREMLSNMLDLYHSNLQMKMNQIMKVMTIMTTIFVPLTFLVG
ncbi:MAG: magnesium/cobalt transporter CorA, partial [Flavobacteriales bacterium]